MLAYLLSIKWDEVTLLSVYVMTVITIFTNTNNGHPVCPVGGIDLVWIQGTAKYILFSSTCTEVSGVENIDQCFGVHFNIVYLLTYLFVLLHCLHQQWSLVNTSKYSA